MVQHMAVSSYETDRAKAAKLLKITQRTLDRYIRAGKLSARNVNGRIFLSQKEIMAFKRGNLRPPGIIPSAPKELLRKFPGIYGNQSISDAPQTRDIGRAPAVASREDFYFYRDLYEQTLRLLEEKEQKLESANYRIGQLESQNTASFLVRPLSGAEKSNDMVFLAREIEDIKKQNQELFKKWQLESRNRKIIAAILYATLLLQPLLWYFLRPGL